MYDVISVKKRTHWSNMEFNIMEEYYISLYYIQCIVDF